jgi:hypothetical protein
MDTRFREYDREMINHKILVGQSANGGCGSAIYKTGFACVLPDLIGNPVLAWIPAFGSVEKVLFFDF